MANLYLLFIAWCKSKDASVPCKSTFYQVFKEWSHCLRFHKKSTHSMCKTCSELRSKIHAAKDALPPIAGEYLLESFFSWGVGLLSFVSFFFQIASKNRKQLSIPSVCINSTKDFRAHATHCDELLQHYTQQFRDREVYWVARQFSQAKQGLLTVIIDSYDKAKLSVPRWPFNRCPKKSVYEETRRTLVDLNIPFFKF